MSLLGVSLVVCRLATVLIYNKVVGFLSRTVVPRKKTSVTIEQGTLKGLLYKTKVSNKPYVSFVGIPYAQPPVRFLRFKPPVKHAGWSGVFNAFTPGDMCMQYSFLTNQICGSEDCLFLNVFVPQDEPNEKKAVMIFIHGGAFNNGTSSPELYSPDYLIDENVIVVTINYRLNVLGFLNLDIEECPGNMGLKDQLLAIKWVKTNISAFGGDAENITIFGESAGSASVHCHTLSPRSTGLFQKAIMQSGCIFNSWALNENPRQSAYNLARKLGCQRQDPEAIIQYLLTLPASVIVKLSKIEGVTDFRNYEFIPSIESNPIVTDRFLPAHPEILAKSVTPVPIISGINNLEGMIAFAEPNLKKLISTTEEINNLFENKYSEEVINKVKSFYFDEGNLECGTTKLENNCHLYSDAFFSKDFFHGFNHLLYNVTPVYNYEFKFDGKINLCKNILSDFRPKLKSLKGACHADELNYLFFGQIFGYTPNANSPELRMCRTLSKLWSNFAKTGNPNSSDLSFEWNQTSLEKPKYLSLDGDDTCMVDGILNSSRMHFWENISKMVQSEQKL